MMTPFSWWLVLAAVLLGHFGLHLTLYNRVNATGLPRLLIKLIVKLLFLEMLITPVAVVLLIPEPFHELWSGQVSSLSFPPLVRFYGYVCLATWAVFGLPWLLWRPIFGIEWVDASRKTTVVDVQAALGKPLARSHKCRIESRLPLNQIFELAVEQIDLPVVGLPEKLAGYRIAHLSDIHLTGDLSPQYAKYAVERASEWSPELIALTGDIVDKQACIARLEEIFSPARATDGCYFILGNHDLRVVDPGATRQAMERAGWTDLGGRSAPRNLRDVPSRLIGNEYPWFKRPQLESSTSDEFRLLLSHSPDQLSWAQTHQVQLMLAGHTHGGQGRLPVAGPLLSPSLYGSRYASGDFYKAPTTMHVSRGMGGVHLLRINCRPELSLITLRPSAMS